MARARKPHHDAVGSAAEVDARYGLEPVIEVDGGASALGAFVDVHCPHCGETYGLAVDLSAEARHFIEDCTVCCRPIALSLEVEGERVWLSAERPG